MSNLSAPESHPLKFMLRALRYRNYRLFFCGQIVSLTGNWITTTALAWLAYRLTGSALLLGAVAFCSQLPAFLLLPFAGLVVDRYNRRKLLMVTQFLSMIQSFGLAALTLSGEIRIPWLLALCVFQGLINAFDMPCRQAFAVEMVEDKKDLGNAIALNSSLFNLARLAGPAIGGIIITAVGEGWCFFIDGISYFAVLTALSAMAVKPRPAPKHTGSYFSHFKEGLRYAAGFKPIRSIILLTAFINLVGGPYTVLMPVFADDILHGGPHTLGFLMSSIGAGAMLGALWLAGRKTVLGLGRIIAFAAGIFGTGLIAFSFSRSLPLSMPLLVAIGCGFMLQMASFNTILQTLVEDDKRGRIMSLFIMAFMGPAPFGSLLAGALTHKIGAPMTLTLGGLSCIAGGIWFYRQIPELRKMVRPIYKNLGIIPDMAAGIETAGELPSAQEE